jgi:hypothetical protein
LKNCGEHIYWERIKKLVTIIKIASLKLRNGENESEIENYRNPKRERRK